MPFAELLVDYISPDDVKIQDAIIKRLSTYCKRPVTNYTLDEYEDPYQWTFFHSMFFAFTVCSTLGKLHGASKVALDSRDNGIRF